METIRKGDANYPKLLKELSSPPKKLYIRGNKEILNNDSIAIVGSRKPTAYGKSALADIAEEIVAAGVQIISGMAFGIDALAHRTALNAKVPTIAILGSGLNDESIYPQTNLGLAREILSSGGALISEYPPNTEVKPYHFVVRNRIISGMSRAVVVIEAGEKSGSTITGNHALSQHRQLYAVPGSIYSPLSKGTNWLLSEGAQPATSGQEILEKVSLDYQKINDKDQEELFLIRKTIKKAPKTLSQIQFATKFPTKKLLTLLTRLELGGQIRRLSGQLYINNEELSNR